MQSGFTSWSDVGIFLGVLRTGSTLAAAHLLHIAQPTVSRRIDVLEHALKLTLFERDTRGFHPTQDARHLKPLAEALEASAAALGQAAMRRRSHDARPIRLTASACEWQQGLPQSMEDLDGHRFVVIEAAHATTVVNTRLPERLPASQIASRRSDIESAIAAVKAGFGIGALPCSHVRNDPDLVRCFLPPAGQDIHSWLLVSSEAWRRPEVRRFFGFFVSRYLRVLRPGPD